MVVAGQAANLPKGRIVRWTLASILWLLMVGCHTVFDGELGLVACRDEGAFGVPACPAWQTCLQGTCAAIGAPLGHPCETDGECRDGSFCFDPAQPSAGAAVSGKARCSRPCCDSTDCGPYQDGQVCWSQAAGPGAFCWPASALEQRANPGPNLAGQECSDAADCRSSVCVDGGCVDSCCLDTQCGQLDPPLTCRIRAVSELFEGSRWACGEPSAPHNNSKCMADHECASNLCIGVGPDTKLCARPCCSSTDCGGVLVKDKVIRLACVPVLGGTAQACAEVVPDDATKVVGASCSSNAECRSGLCVQDEGASYCSDLCCDDASCGDSDTFTCLPRPLSASWALRCVRK